MPFFFSKMIRFKVFLSFFLLSILPSFRNIVDFIPSNASFGKYFNDKKMLNILFLAFHAKHIDIEGNPISESLKYFYDGNLLDDEGLFYAMALDFELRGVLLNSSERRTGYQNQFAILNPLLRYGFSLSQAVVLRKRYSSLKYARQIYFPYNGKGNHWFLMIYDLFEQHFLVIDSVRRQDINAYANEVF